MRHEFAFFRRQPGPPQAPLDLALKIGEFAGKFRTHDQRLRALAAELVKSLESHRHWRAGADLGERGIDLVRHMPVDIADETQGEMVIFRIDPARTRQAGAKQREPFDEIRGDFETCEQAWHRRLPSFPSTLIVYD